MAAPQTLPPSSAAPAHSKPDASLMGDFVLFDDDPLYSDFRPPNFISTQASFDQDHYSAPPVSGSYVAMLGDQSMAGDLHHQQGAIGKPFYDMPSASSALSFESHPAYTFGSDMPLSMAPFEHNTPAPAPGVLIHPPTFPTPAHLSQLSEYRTPISPATSAGGLEGHSSAGSDAGSTGSPFTSSINIDEFNPAYVDDIDPSLINIPSPSLHHEDPLSASSSRASPSWHSAHSPPPTSNPSSPEFEKKYSGRLSPQPRWHRRSAPYPSSGSRRQSISSQSSQRSHGSPSGGYPLDFDELYPAIPGEQFIGQPLERASSVGSHKRAPSSNGSGVGSSSGGGTSSGKDTLCPECKKSFRDLKAHQLTHQLERPVKCPIATCEYSKKGFARKYDCQRHTLTHYKGTMVCGFCPGSGSAAEKSFNRADVFKRHLMSVHNVEQTPPNSRKRPANGKQHGIGNASPVEVERYSGSYITGKCSTCSVTFATAQQFYEHLDECVLSKVVQEEPAAAFNEINLDSVKLEDMEATASISPKASGRRSTKQSDEDEEEDADEDDEENDDEDDVRDGTFTVPRKSASGSSSARLTRSKKGSIKRTGSGAGSAQR